jgi:hypothetical protein
VMSAEEGTEGLKYHDITEVLLQAVWLCVELARLFVLQLQNLLAIDGWVESSQL